MELYGWMDFSWDCFFEGWERMEGGTRTSNGCEWQLCIGIGGAHLHVSAGSGSRDSGSVGPTRDRRDLIIIN